jgi:hypothetical protein
MQSQHNPVMASALLVRSSLGLWSAGAHLFACMTARYMIVVTEARCYIGYEKAERRLQKPSCAYHTLFMQDHMLKPCHFCFYFTLKWMSLGMTVSPRVRVLRQVCLLVPGVKASSGRGGRFSKS